jgi:hypothetical protein
MLVSGRRPGGVLRASDAKGAAVCGYIPLPQFPDFALE